MSSVPAPAPPRPWPWPSGGKHTHASKYSVKAYLKIRIHLFGFLWCLTSLKASPVCSSSLFVHAVGHRCVCVALPCSGPWKTAVSLRVEASCPCRAWPTGWSGWTRRNGCRCSPCRTWAPSHQEVNRRSGSHDTSFISEVMTFIVVPELFPALVIKNLDFYNNISYDIWWGCCATTEGTYGLWF